MFAEEQEQIELPAGQSHLHAPEQDAPRCHQDPQRPVSQRLRDDVLARDRQRIGRRSSGRATVDGQVGHGQVDGRPQCLDQPGGGSCRLIRIGADPDDEKGMLVPHDVTSAFARSAHDCYQCRPIHAWATTRTKSTCRRLMSVPGTIDPSDQMAESVSTCSTSWRNSYGSAGFPTSWTAVLEGLLRQRYLPASNVWSPRPPCSVHAAISTSGGMLARSVPSSGFGSSDAARGPYLAVLRPCGSVPSGRNRRWRARVTRTRSPA